MGIVRASRKFIPALIAASTLTAGIVAIAPRPAQSRTEFQPIDITTPYPITPGAPLECDVTLTGGPANVTLYSNPSGAVSYSGTVSGSSAAIQATTSAGTSGPVTVYLVTDGATVVSTKAPMQAPPPQ